jgi:hypothetical protein
MGPIIVRSFHQATAYTGKFETANERVDYVY